MKIFNEINQLNKYFLGLIAIFIIPISGLSIDIYVPSLPMVSSYFHVDKSLVQLSITYYMLGAGLMQLIAGGISDSFGRKKPFLIAALIYFFITLFISLSNNIYQLLVLRFIQGIAVGMMVVPIRSVIPDLFAGRELYKMMGYMTMAWSVGPIVAPAIGAYLQQYFSWKANFYFLAIYSLLGFIWVLFYLPETSLHRHPFQVTKIFKRYKEILFHIDYLNGLIINGLLYSITILFAVVGSFLIQTELHYSVVQFGQITLLVGLSWFIGTITNRFTMNIDFQLKTKFCFWMMLLASLIMLLLAIFLPVNIYSIVVPVLILTWLGGIVFPNYFARSVALFPTMSGSANALLGAFIFLISGLSSALGTFLKCTNQLPLSIAYVGLISLCLIVRFYLVVSVNKLCAKDQKYLHVVEAGLSTANSS
jgi:DHA1 family bicyclomycin/chloramphenicol resistance-like MFS transporter